MEISAVYEFSAFLNLFIVLSIVAYIMLIPNSFKYLLLGVVDLVLLSLIVLLFYPRVNVEVKEGSKEQKSTKKESTTVWFRIYNWFRIWNRDRSKEQESTEEESMTQGKKIDIWFRVYNRVSDINIITDHKKTILKRNEKGEFLFVSLNSRPSGLTEEFLEKVAKLTLTSFLIHKKTISIFWFPEIFTIFISFTLLKNIDGSGYIMLFILIAVSFIFLFKFKIVNERLKKTSNFLNLFISDNWLNLVSSGYRNYRSFLWLERNTLNQIISDGLEINAWKLIGKVLPFRVR